LARAALVLRVVGGGLGGAGGRGGAARRPGPAARRPAPPAGRPPPPPPPPPHPPPVRADGRAQGAARRMSGPHPLAFSAVEALDRFAVVITLAVVLLVWELAVDLAGIPRYVLPAPSDIWASMVAHAGSLLGHSWVTLLETLAGFGVSLAIGIPLAVLIVYSRIFDRILYPILVASQAVPKVALAPILLVALGYSVLPKIIVAFLIAFFPVVV